MSADFQLDFARQDRIGLGEAILCDGKSAGQVGDILHAADRRGASLLLTRCAPTLVSALDPALQARLDYDPVSRTGYFGTVPPAGADTALALVTAGTSDVPVAREAERTLRFNGCAPRVIADVGVAGLWRLQARLPEIAECAVVIAVAGMDAALPTVLAGLVAQPVIGVPTSTGYGAARGGETALMAMLSSCAPGLTVVNIDNGYGAACAALRILRRPGASRTAPS